MLTQTKSVGDQCVADKCNEDYVELLEAGEDSAEALEAAEQSFSFVAPLVHLAVVLLGRYAGAQWWHHRHIALLKNSVMPELAECWVDTS